MLVVHGIGEQNPYETLDSFARGVFTHLTRKRQLNAKLCPIEIAHKDWTQVGMRIGIFPKDADLPFCPAKGDPVRQEDEPAAYVDLYEYYWAPDTEDKLSAVETVKWVLFTDFTPLKYFADNLQEMIGAQRMSRPRALCSALKLYAREMLRVVFLYLTLGLGMLWLLGWLLKPHAWGPALKTLATGLWPYISWTHGLILFFYVLFLMMAWFGLQALAELRGHPGAAIEKEGDRIWLVCTAVLAALFLGAGLAIDLRSGSFAVWHMLQIVTRNGNWKPLAGTALAWIVSYAMTAYVADVAVYTNMDAKSKSYAARNAILSGSTAALKMLLANDSYERVILAGHSLGSVIAYDTINELLVQYNAASGPGSDHPDPGLTLAHLQKLKGLVTFGSPLDKVYYFFREHVKRDQAIRAQILSMLHSFRKKPSGRDYGEFAFEYSFRQLDGQEGLLWLNAWARWDLVSAELKFYHPDNQCPFPYRAPVLAHLKYWHDPSFYDYFCQKLL